MTYANRNHVHNKEVKVRFDAEKHERLRRIAMFKGRQPAALVRLYVEAIMDEVEQNGFSKIDELLEKRRA